MKLDKDFDPKKTTKLFGLKDKFLFFNKLLKDQNAPKVVMFTGKKGLGKFTLINHLIHNYFDKKNYDMNNNKQHYIFQKLRLQNHSNLKFTNFIFYVYRLN